MDEMIEYVKGYTKNGTFIIFKKGDVDLSTITDPQPATEIEYLDYIADITSNI